MNSLLFAVALLAVTPEPSQYADTESVTNIVININVERLDRLRIALDFDTGERTNLEVALGTDADGDGMLSTDEMALRVGYDCGQWKSWSLRDNVETIEPLLNTNAIPRAVVIPWKQFDPNWNLLRVTRRGLFDTTPFVSVVQDTKYFNVLIK